MHVALNIELLIEEYSKYVYKVIDNLAGEKLTSNDKEEIVADTFYLLWKNQDKEVINLKAYLATIAKNCTYNRLKQKHYELEYDDTYLNYQVDMEKEYHDLMMINEKLDQLSDEEKEIFELYYVEGYKIKEIALMKNQKNNAIKVKLHRIRNKLKKVR